MVMERKETNFVISVLQKNWNLLVSVGVFSGVLNVLALTGAIYMLQVYDRVIPSRSIPTLIGLTVILVLMFAANGVLDVLRTRILSRIAIRLDESLRETLFNAVQLLSLRAGGETDGLQPVRDLDKLRGFLSGIGPAALFDLPWIPVYLALIFMLHPMMGWFAVAGAFALIAITLATELLSRGPNARASISGGMRLALAGSAARNAEAVRSMGMGPTLNQHWQKLSDRHIEDQIGATDAVAGLGVSAKVLRLLLQSGILGLGAYLAVIGQVSPGAIIAGSIVMSRALAPIETITQQWRGFLEARQATQRLKKVVAAASTEDREVTELPVPQQTISIETVSVSPPGSKSPTVQAMSFSLQAGEALGVIGPSGSGKTSLARAIVGVWPVLQGGAIRFDGAAIDQWLPSEIGRHIGYMPQNIQLFDGTIAENIARLAPDATDESVVAAAMAAGVHELIVGLPEGYQTRITENGGGLSAGQRQRVALARALYGDPFLVVLDEPNSNLDSAGDVALSNAIQAVKERKGIVIVIAHRPAAIAHVDKVLAMAGGKLQAIGPKDEVLRKVLVAVPNSPAAVPATVPATAASGVGDIFKSRRLDRGQLVIHAEGNEATG
jgi:ATP-binding cassette subfamily C protein